MDPAARKATTLAAFAVIYLVWGSTYLAIRWAIESIPPFFMIGSRTFLAGALLYGWARLGGAAPPSRSEWGLAASTGALLFVGGQGVLAFAQQRVPSGAAALVVATIPLWMTMLEALRDGSGVLTGRVAAGLLLGFGGVALLIEPGRLLGGHPLDPAGVALLLLASLSWSAGSILGHRRAAPRNFALATGSALLAGGTCLLAASLPSGEVAAFLSGEAVPLRSLLSFGYLIVFGSVIGFGSYAWLLTVSTPSRVSTYAFVNPVVAVVLGAALGGEALGARVAAATLLMVAAVALIITGGAETRRGAGREPGIPPVRGALAARCPEIGPKEAS